MFSPPKRHLGRELKIKFNGKKFHQIDSVNSLGNHLNNYLIWKHEINDVAIKLNKAYKMLYKIRHCLEQNLSNQFIMEFFNYIYPVLHWFGYKNHHLLND